MVEVRRRVQHIGPHGSRPAFEPAIVHSRYLQLTRFDQLPTERVEALGRVLSDRPDLEAAWRMLQHLCGIHITADEQEANQALGAFIEVWQETGLDEFDRLVETLLKWEDEIFAFHTADRAKNGRIEGSNNEIGVLKLAAYRFVNTTNFAARALLHPRYVNMTEPNDESLTLGHRADPKTVPAGLQTLHTALPRLIRGESAMDLNLVVLCGRLATDPELREFDSGARYIRYLITTRVDYPRKRTDVIPVTLWDPPDQLIGEPGVKGERVWVCGAVQRRYWESPDGRRSRVEVVAEQVNFKEVEDLEPVTGE